MFLYNAVIAIIIVAELTLTAKVLSLKMSLTFKMGPYEPLAMKPRICEHRGSVNSMFPLLCFLKLLNSPYVEVQSTRKWSRPGNLRCGNSGRKTEMKAGGVPDVSALSSGGSRSLGTGGLTFGPTG